MVNSESFHILIHEQVLIDGEYPVRSEKSGKVKMENHRVIFMDNNGVPHNFVVNEGYPNGTTGLIVCILGIAK